MSRYILLVSVVPHDRAELISNAAVAAGSFGGTVAMGRGMTGSGVLAALGFGDTSQDIVYILTEESQKAAIATAITAVCANERHKFGCMFSLPVDSMLKTGIVSGGDSDNMEGNKPRELITVILNRGYADDAMAAARKAGAGGGTVINARGTAREDDAKFFGMHIVPEKEMLLIVVEQEKKAAVLEAIRTLPCLAEPGSGIAFCSGVDEFTLLGKK